MFCRIELFLFTDERVGYISIVTLSRTLSDFIIWPVNELLDVYVYVMTRDFVDILCTRNKQTLLLRLPLVRIKIINKINEKIYS